MNVPHPRRVIAVLLLIAFAPSLAQACSSSAGGACKCGTGCTCCSNHNDKVGLAAAVTPVTSAVDPSSDVTIQIKDFTYVPREVTVYLGTTITWVNVDPVAHDAVSSYGLFNSFYLAEGGRFSFTFDTGTDGQWDYYCSLHGGMDGLITVLVPEPALAGPAAALVLLARRRRFMPP
jgi:plastocyanin